MHLAPPNTQTGKRFAESGRAADIALARLRVGACGLLLLSFHVFAEPLPITLNQAENRLSLVNREIAMARRAAESANADIAIAGQAPNPVLGYSVASVSPNRGIGAGRFSDKRVDHVASVSQLFERGSKRELRAESAEALARAAHADLDDVGRQQRMALHHAYYDLKAAADRLALHSETDALYRKSLEAAEMRLKHGDLAAVDVNRLRIEALRAQNEVRGARAEVLKAQRALSYILGEDARKEDLAAVDEWPKPIEARVTPGMLERRPDVRAAFARIDAATKARDLSRRLTTRDVTVGLQVERDRTGLPPDSGVSYGVSVSVPLFVRYGFEGEMAKAETAFSAAVEDRERVLALAEVEALRARDELSAADEKLRRIESEVLPAARQVAVSAEYAFRRGAMALMDLLDARRTLRAVELDAVAARGEHAKAQAAWLAATEW